MIDVGNVSFACDECGICEQLEWRSRVAQELGETLQFDHCSCAKVGDEFWAGGYCGDAFIKNPPNRDGGNRKTGRAYRRRMHTGIGMETSIFLAPMLSTPRAQKIRCSTSVCQTRQSAAVKTFHSRATDIAKCLTTGGRLLRG